MSGNPKCAALAPLGADPVKEGSEGRMAPGAGNSVLETILNS